MNVTTYQHDYLPPSTKRYDFVKRQEKSDDQKTECKCAPEEDISKTKQKKTNVEWTGIAPMGRLIDPRIIPTKFSDEQVELMISDNNKDCYKSQPNRFLKILRTEYPDLYERLKQLPKDELSRRLDGDRMNTTYQVDFCGINEYPEGVYKSLKVEDEASKLNASKLLQRKEPCEDLRRNVMDDIESESSSPMSGACEKSYKPFTISFADSSQFINSGNNSHWQSNVSKKTANLSEYMETINKIGGVIMKSNIHDHQKCTRRNCKHQLLGIKTNN